MNIKEINNLTEDNQILFWYNLITTNKEGTSFIDILSKMQVNSNYSKNKVIKIIHSTKQVLELEQQFANKFKQGYANNYELISCYHDLIEKLLSLAQMLDLKNSLELSNLYSYLLWNGYFSNTKQHYYFQRLTRPSIDKLPFEIMNGEGVCINYSIMLKDILNQAGFISAVILNNMPKKLKSTYRPSIKRSYQKSSLLTKARIELLKLLLDPNANHAANLIYDQKGVYIYDSTNLWTLTLKNPEKASLLAGNGQITLDLMGSYCSSFSNLEKAAILNLYQKSSFQTPYDQEKYIATWEKNLLLFEQNQDILEKYYQTTKPNIETICGLMNCGHQVQHKAKVKRKGPTHV